MQVKIDIDDRAARRILARLSPSEIERRNRAALKEVLTLAQAEVQKQTPVDRDVLRGGIAVEMHGSGVTLTGRVVPPAAAKAYAHVVEVGRKPGKMPPISAIEGWASRHGMSGRSVAFLIARAIGRRGTKGSWMFRSGLAVAQKNVLRVFLHQWRQL